MKPLIVANWKMNPQTLDEAREILNEIKEGIKDITGVEIVICPSFLYLPYWVEFFNKKEKSIKLGAQDCFWQKSGAFTGEISSKQLLNFGCQYVIIGHSERRKYLGETDEMINKKLKSALKEKLKPILCIENISQIKNNLKEIAKNELKDLILAFEPVFAIGTGKPCNINKAKKMRITIKRELDKNIPILYGGSVSSQNAINYLKNAGFSGLLVGGASLNPKEFIKIIKNISQS